MRSLLLVLLAAFLSIKLCAQNESLTWVSSLGLSGGNNGLAITADSNGNIYTLGTFGGSLIVETANSIDTLVSHGLGDIYIEKVDSLGVVQWVKGIGGTLEDNAYSIKVNSNSELIICGNYKGYVDFDPGDSSTVLNGNTNYYFAFVLKLNAEGEFIWAKNINGQSSAYSLVLNESDEIYITGEFNGTSDFDPGTGVYNLAGNGYTDIFLWKLNDNGEFLMAKSMGGSDYDSGRSIDLDLQGNILIAGEFGETVDFNPGAGVYNISANVSSDIFVLKLNSQGNFIWAKSFGGVNIDRLSSMSIDDNSNIYLTGMFQNTVDFDPGSGLLERTSVTNSKDIFVLKLDGDGIFVWVNTYGNTGWDLGGSVFAKEEDVYITGFFENSVDFDHNVDSDYFLSSIANDRSGYLLKLGSDGEFLWANSIGGEYSRAKDVYCNDDGEVYVIAEFYESIYFIIDNDTIIVPDGGGNISALLQKYKQVPCSNFVILEDSISNLSCEQDGYFGGHAVFGIEPYNYSVNQVDMGDELAFIIDNNGVYTIEVQDAGICSITKYLQVESPSYMSDFDLSANLIENEFRPGFSSDFILDAYNDACDTIGGVLTIVLDSLLSFESSLIEVDTINADSTYFSWNFTQMNYDSAHFTPQFSIYTSVDAQIGDTVCIDVLISPIVGDADTLNNTKHYCFPIINGYDPNDKQVYPQGICNDHFVLNDEKLTYTIRFQNTGNAEAINIHILDSLSPYLDLSTFNVVSSSHDMHLEVLEANVLDFKFDNILLPDSNSNEEASHGYVIFEVNALEGLDFIEVSNKSEIYFDFNPPIVTNTVSTILVAELPLCADIAASVNQEMISQNNRVYPNPNSGKFNIDISDIDNVCISIFNLSGQLIYKRENLNAKTHQIEIEDPSGLYILTLSSKGRKEHFKIIKR